MNIISEKISGIDWQRVTEEMNEKGYALVLQFLPNQYCEELIGEYDNSDLYRKTITMERLRFGLGEYKYFKYPLLPFAGLKFVVNISISPLLGVKTMAFDCALGVCCVNTNSPPV